MIYLANDHGVFNGEGVMQNVREPLVDMLYSTLSQHCKESGCTLCTKDEGGRYDIDKETGEITDRLVFHDGNPNAKIVFIGEAPGVGERNTFIPFVGATEIAKSKCVQCSHFKECFRTIL